MTAWTAAARGLAWAGLAACTVAAAPPPGDDAAIAVVAAVHAGAQDVSTKAEGQDPQLSWASWTEGTPDHWLTRLVLIRQAEAGAAITWGVQRPDGYGAVLRPTPWQWEGHPVVILQYQFGAAYTRVELWAAGPESQGRMLGQVDGALIAVERRGVEANLRAFDESTLRGPQRCYTWRTAAGRLMPVHCNPARTAPP